MKALTSFFRKELLEYFRSGRLLLILLIFCSFGVISPVITKLTPLLLEKFGDSLSTGGIVIDDITASALMSWGEFFESVGMALVAFVLVCGGSFTREYGKGTLQLVLTKGLARYKVLLAKTLTMLVLWCVGYWLCFGVTYGLNACLFSGESVAALAPVAVSWWLFGIFVVALTVFFSVVANNYGIVLLGVGGSVFAMYIVSLIPKIAKYLPTALMSGMGLLSGVQKADELVPAIIITVALSIALVAVSVPIFNKKQL